MNKSTNHQGISQKIPQKISHDLQNPPVLKTEDPTRYWQFVDLLVEAIKPVHIVEWIHLKDIADYSWETFRIQRYKGAIVDLARRRAVGSVLRTLLPHVTISSNVADGSDPSRPWVVHGPENQARGHDTPQSVQFDPRRVDAEAFLLSIPKLQAIDEMLGIAAVRRDASMREIERGREAVAYLEPKRVVEAKVVKPFSDAEYRVEETMASDRTIAANRRNATASTGPRTPHGKARASRNARKHGLTVPLVLTQDGPTKSNALRGLLPVRIPAQPAWKWPAFAPKPSSKCFASVLIK